MLNEMRMKVAFATNSRERVDMGFEQARKIVIYEVGIRDAHSVGSYTFASPRKRAPKCKLQTQENRASAKCKDKKQCPDRFDEENIIRRVATLDGVSVLVINKDLQAYSALALKQVHIYPIKVDSSEFIGVVIKQFQELMKSNTPLWLRRSIARVAL
jgi:hypothetical protein